MDEAVRLSKQTGWIGALTLLVLSGCAAEDSAEPRFDVRAFAQQAEESGYGESLYGGAYCVDEVEGQLVLRGCEQREEVRYVAFYVDAPSYVDAIRGLVYRGSDIVINVTYAIPSDDWNRLDRVQKDYLLLRADELHDDGAAVFGITDARNFCSFVLDPNDYGYIFPELPVSIRGMSFLLDDGSDVRREYPIGVITNETGNYQVTCVDRPPLRDVI